MELHPGIQISNKEVTVKPKFAMYVKNKVSFTLYKYKPSGREIPDSHLAPKFFKVVAN